MESLELRIFQEVAFEKSISKAAKKMGYVQPNITSHIHNLETELETILFIRHSKGVSLTDEGRQLLLYADQIISLLDNAKNQFRSNKPAIKIGATQTIAANRLPLWLSKYKNSYPNVSFSVSTQLQSELVESVAAGILDCAFVNTEFNHPKLISAFSFNEALAFITPKSLNPKEIAWQSIIVSNSLGCPYRHLLESWVVKKTSKIPNTVEYDTLEGITKAVSLGIGVSLLPINVLGDKATNDFHSFPANGVGEVNIQLVILKDFTNPCLIQFVDVVKSF